MGTQFLIENSDRALLEKAARVARDFAQPYATGEIVGIVFLGAIVRGYFDHAADIDIAIFKRQRSAVRLDSQYLKVEGLEIHCHLSDYESEVSAAWNMAKRWTFSQRQIHYDPEGRIARLLEEKVPLRPDERRWLLMSGLALSDWYINRLAPLWVERGDPISAHHMFAQGLNHFYEMLFALNNELVADVKWRYYCAERLPRLPRNFKDRLKETLMLQEFSEQDLERRRAAFMAMWQDVLPAIEQEVQLPYAEIVELV
jgi:hypothetical protein